MVRGVRSPLAPGLRSVIRVKWPRLAEATDSLNVTTEVGRARFFDLDLKTLHNMKRGGYVGGRVVANVLTALSAYAKPLQKLGFSVGFDEFFFVTEEEDEVAS